MLPWTLAMTLGLPFSSPVCEMSNSVAQLSITGQKISVHGGKTLAGEP